MILVFIKRNVSYKFCSISSLETFERLEMLLRLSTNHKVVSSRRLSQSGTETTIARALSKCFFTITKSIGKKG